MKPSTMTLIADWGVVLVTVLDDFLGFLPTFLFLSLTSYIMFRLGYEVTNLLFEEMFGRSILTHARRAKVLFSFLLMSFFLVLTCGSPLKWNINPNPGAFPAILVFSLILGGSVFTYFFSQELLRWSNLERFSGPIPNFWRKTEKTGRDDTFRKNWTRTLQMPKGAARRVSIMAVICASALLLVLAALVFAAIFSLTLYFSIIFDVVILGWLAFMILKKRGLLLSVSKNNRSSPEIEKSFVQSVFSGYSRLGPKTLGIWVCLTADMGAIVYNAIPFLILCSSLPSFLKSLDKLAIISFPIILFGSIISFELYSWWLMARRTSNFLQVWQGRRGTPPKIKPFPPWATLLFALSWYPLIVQEFLLGPHFYPYSKELSLAFLTSPGLHDWIAISVFVFMSAICLIGLIRLTRESAIQPSERDVLSDNRRYGFVSVCLWISAMLVWMFTESGSLVLPLTGLYLVLVAIYMADIARLIDNRYQKTSWIHRVLYYGYIWCLIAPCIILAPQFALLDATSVYVVLSFFCALFVFFVWLDAKWQAHR